MATDTTRPLEAKTAVDDLCLRVDSSRGVGERVREIVDIFNQYGVVIVEFKEEESARNQLLCFKELFGSSLPHDRADEDMIAEIAVSKRFEGYLGTSNLEHSFHTDGAYSAHPPRVVALRCETPATTGGVSQLAGGEALYRYLLSEGGEEMIRALSAPDALCVTRVGKGSCQALFQESDGRISLRYRADETSVPSTDPLVQRGMQLIQAYLEDPANSMSFLLKRAQVLLTDNTRTLHARTSFPETEPRKMHRLFFDGLPEKNNGLTLGFAIE